MKTLCFFLIYISEAIILSLYCYKLFTKKISSIAITMLYSSTYSILFMISFINNPYINLCAFTVVNFICISVGYKGKLLNTLFHVFITTVAMLATEVFALSIFTNISNSLFYNKSINNTSLLLASVLSKLLYFFVLYGITHLFQKGKTIPLPNYKEIILLSLVPILSIGILVTCFTVSIIYPQLPHQISLILLICSFFIVLLNLIIFWIYEYIGSKNKQFLLLQLQLQKESDNTAYYKKLIEQDENQKILIHDIKKHLQSIYLLNEANEPAKISSYLDNVLNSPALQTSLKICNHEFLNGILSRYKLDAERRNISVIFDIRNHSIDFMSDDNITILFCNLLDNAINASTDSVNAFIELSVTTKENTSFTTITLQNSCHSEPNSNKSHPSGHGFGLKSIEKAVELYNGSINYFYDKTSKTFHTVILLSNNYSD